MDDTITNCPECKEEFDTQECGVFSEIAGDYYCEACYQSDLEYASTLIVFDRGEVKRYNIGDLFRVNEYGDDASIEVERKYTSTDAWRGFHNTSVVGSVTVLDGWTTGGWGDPVADRKAVFNEWLENNLEYPPVIPYSFSVSIDPTSNLFSSSITVQVGADNADDFKFWLAEELDQLQQALS